MPKTKTKKAQPKDRSPVLDADLVKVLAHPLRHKILVVLNEKTASPKELADELDERLGNVSYHVRVLADLGCVELVATTPRRGAVEHHYRAVRRPYFSDEDWAALPVQARRQIGGQQLGRIVRDLSDAADDGGFDRSDVHVSWTPFDLDQQGYDELTALLMDTLEQAMTIQADSLGRQVAAGPEQQPTKRCSRRNSSSSITCGRAPALGGPNLASAADDYKHRGRDASVGVQYRPRLASNQRRVRIRMCCRPSRRSSRKTAAATVAT